METNAQLIKKGKKIEFAVLPYQEYINMKKIVEDYEDLQILRNAKKEDNTKIGKSPINLLKEIEL